MISYVANDETWHLAWGKKLLSIQEERIKNDCVVERIFLVDSDDEVNLIENVAKSHHQIGIKVSWLLKDKLLESTSVYEAHNNLRTFDVAIADNSWVCLTYLDKKRMITSAEASMKKDFVKAACFMVDEAKRLSNDFKFK